LSQTVFAREREAVRDLNPSSHRMWAVFNPNKLSSLGHPSSYFIQPGMNTVPFLHKKSPVRKRAGFIDHHFFATRHRETELYASGDYPVGSHRNNDLVVWTQNDEDLPNQDVVVWYTLGVTHVARPEDFPVMPAAHASVRLLPKAFWVRNPALDVPDTPAESGAH
jgi:primary-amine oxidase